MKHVRLRLDADGREGEVHPMYGLWTNAEFVTRSTALQWNFSGNELGILHFTVGDADAFEAAVADIPQVLDYELLRVGPERFYVYLRDRSTETLNELVGPITEVGVIVVPPVRYHEDGSVSLSMFGPDDELQATVGAIPDPITATVEQVGGLARTAETAEARLTDRQREALRTALELGYYAVPREASHEDVAAALGCAPSTAAEHLRKGESAVLKSALGV